MNPRNASSRNLLTRDAESASAVAGGSDPADPPEALSALKDAIEDERARLMDVETILHCVVVAMNEVDQADTHAPCYQSVIDVARAILVNTINQLDSVRIGPILDRLAPETKAEMRSAQNT